MFPGLIDALRRLGKIALAIILSIGSYFFARWFKLPIVFSAVFGMIAGLLTAFYFFIVHLQKERQEEEMADAINEDYPGAIA
jgi:hypothetical protein